MTVRYPFGQTMDAFVVGDDGSGGAELVAAATVTFWDTQTDGSQYTDLALDLDGMSPISSVATEDGSGTLARGTWPIFFGPPGITKMWASANDGPRQLVQAAALADIVDDAVGDDFASNYQTQGDLVAGGSGGEPTRVTVGADGTVLTADSGSSSGVSWQAPDAASISDGAVTTTKLADGAVTAAKWDSTDFNAGVRASRLDQMATPTVAVGMGSKKITSLADGTATTDAATFGQVDAKAPKASPTFSGTVTLPTVILAGQVASPSDALSVVSAHVSTDASLGNYFRVAATGNFTLDNPTNPTDGQSIEWEIVQDATGSRVMTLGSKFALGTDLSTAVLTTTASKRDFLTARYNSTTDKWYIRGFLRGYP